MSEADECSYVDILFDGPPGPESGRFVECESPEGVGIKLGEWIDRGDGYCALRIPKPSEMPTETVWAVVANTDLTEGKGGLEVVAYCSLEATARRLSKGRDVQGSDARVRRVEGLCRGGDLYAPITVVRANQDDREEQARLDQHRAAVEKARAAGLTDDELRLLVKP